MAKQRIAIGLDVGAQSVKMVCMEAKGKSVSIAGYKIKEYNQKEGSRDNAISEILKDIDAIKIQYKSRQAVPIIAGADGSQVFIRVFKLPGVAKSKLDKIVAYEAQQQVPFPIEEVIWSYQCLRRVSPEETDVLLSAIRAGVMKDFLASLGTDVADIVPPVLGLNNLLDWFNYEGIKDETGQAVMILDLGAKTTNVIILEKNYYWFRTIPLGGEIITQAISSEYNIGFSEAEILKKEKGEVVLEGERDIEADRRRISACIIKPLSRLSNEVFRSIEVYSSSFNSLGPRKIFITGGGSGIKNIKDFFNKKFRVDVNTLQFTKNFSIQDIIGKGELNDSMRLGTAFGLALHGLGFGGIKLSLLPKEILKKYKWLNREAYLLAVSGLLIFLGISFSGYNMQMANIYKAGISKLGTEKKEADSNKRKIMDIQKELDIVRNKLDKISKVKDAHNYWLEMLLGLEELIPNNIWLVGVEPVGLEEKDKKKGTMIFDYKKYSQGTIDLKITGKTTGQYQDIVVFRDALNNSEYFIKDSVKVVSANPPAIGVRDFVMELKAKVTNED